MKKTELEETAFFKSGWEKVLMIMKLTFFLIFLGLTGVSASVYSQSKKLTLNVENETIREVFDLIESQSEFVFIYKKNVIDPARKVNLKVEELTIEKVLDKLFTNSDIKYEILNRQIILTPNRSVKSKPVDIHSALQLEQPQQKEITGKVTDTGNLPLPGVSVIVKGTTIGTVTNTDGEFSLNIPLNAETLQFSFVGMKTQEIVVGDQTTINIVMEEETFGIEEVVAVGYGTVKKSDLTGSISSIKADELEKQGPRINFVQALQGAAPGLNITQTGNSASSGSINVRIRGQNSILASNNPLVILDGVPYDGGLNLIDQSTIESIEVLKDASSSAIYGARGANGVILITTKKGEKGKPTISYDGSYGVKQIYGIPELLTGPEHWEFGVERYGESSISTNYPTRVENYNNGVSTNWVEEATRLGTQNKHTVGISGGADRVEYFVSGGYMNVKGIAKGDDYENINGRVNLIIKPADWLEIGTRTQYTFQDNSGLEVNFSGGADAPHSISNLGGAFLMNPLISPYDEEGNILIYPWPEMANYPNPLSNLNVLDEDFNRTLFSNNFIQVDFPFIDGLSYKLNTGISYQSANRDIFWGNNTLEGIVNNGQAFSEDRKKNNWLVENLLFYNKSFGNHSLNLTALYSTQKDTYDRTRIFSRGFPTEVLTWYQPGSAEVVTPSRIYSQQSYISQMGRLFYSYEEKYLLTATFRRDGYSAFGSEKKFGVFPSLALGWNVKRESFLVDSDLISQLKLRASYGMNGNQAISPYSTLASVNRKDYLTGPNGDIQGVGFLPKLSGK
jgi:TonB-linked SusC/RagA family outer membrane protein